MAGGVAVLGPGGSVALARSGTGESGARAETEKVNTGPPSSVRFRHPARIPVARGPCQLRERASSGVPPAPGPTLTPSWKGQTRERGTGERLGVESGGLHACASMSACEPKIKEQPRGDPAAAAVAEGSWLAGNAKPPSRVESGRPQLGASHPPRPAKLGAATGSGTPATRGQAQPSS